MNILKRIQNIWFLSGLSKEDIQKNPQTFMTQYVNVQESHGMAYIAGLSEEEEAFNNSLNWDDKDTKLA